MVTGKEVAKRLGVARSTLSEATKKGYLVGGRHDVQSWAIFGPGGRVRGYDIPPAAALAPNEPNSGPNSADSGASTPSADANQAKDSPEDAPPQRAEEGRPNPELASPPVIASLLPPGEDYAHTASAGGGAYVMGKAIEHGNDAVVIGGMTLIGTAVGHAIDKRWGGLIGGLSLFLATSWASGRLQGPRAGSPKATERPESDAGDSRLPASAGSPRAPADGRSPRRPGGAGPSELQAALRLARASRS